MRYANEYLVKRKFKFEELKDLSNLAEKGEFVEANAKKGKLRRQKPPGLQRRVSQQEQQLPLKRSPSSSPSSDNPSVERK